MGPTASDREFKQMLHRARGGDLAAADWLFVSCFDRVRGTIQRKMDAVLRKARVEPEDVVQEAYAAAWANLAEAEFETFAAFLGWIRKIALNKLIDLRKHLLAEKHNVLRRATHGVGGTTSYLDLVERFAGDGSTPSSAAARRDAVAVLVGQMWKLPEDYRRVIQLRFLQGLSVSDVAQQMNRSEGAIHMLCHRALLKMRELMGTPSKYLSRN